MTSVMKIFIGLIILLTAACLFSGCLGGSDKDPILGTWEATETQNTTFMFNENGTCGIRSGALIAEGTWEPDGNDYGLYCFDIRAGTATLNGDDLHLQLTYGMLDLDEDFIRVV